jgi:hypothetical protein
MWSAVISNSQWTFSGRVGHGPVSEVIQRKKEPSVRALDPSTRLLALLLGLDLLADP